MPKKYLTIKEAAEYLGTTPLTLRNWDKSRKFLAGRHPINNYRIYRKEDLDLILKEMESGDTHRLKLSKAKKINVKMED